MKIYDISQEVFGCEIFSGDPKPQRRQISDMKKGDLYNLTCFEMCAHNGTHIDAPYHFFENGKTVDALALTAVIGPCIVAGHNGPLGADGAAAILQSAEGECAKRILIKGDVTVTLEAAGVFANGGILLLGNESQTVGPAEAPAAVHRLLLGKGVVLLEGIRLAEVPQGRYLLNAAPLNLAGTDGAPCRAILMEAD